jgi:hypothetical protein
MLYTCIWKILDLNCGHRHTGYPYCSFPQLLQTSARILSQSGNSLFLPNTFKFINHPSTRCYTI